MHEKRLELSKCKPNNLHVYTWVLVPSKQNIVQMPSTHTARGWGVCVGLRVHTTHLKGVSQQLCPGSESVSKSGLLGFSIQLGEDNQKIVLSKKTVVQMEKGS